MQQRFISAIFSRKIAGISILLNRENGRPIIIDFGSTGCVPCQMMVPVIKDLTSEYQGKIDIQFVDIGEHHQLADRFRVFAIPTQIIFDKHGKEIFRHQGYLPKTEIDKKLKELGQI